jgi:hypothetical protein
MKSRAYKPKKINSVIDMKYYSIRFEYYVLKRMLKTISYTEELEEMQLMTDYDNYIISKISKTKLINNLTKDDCTCVIYLLNMKMC